MKTATFLYYKCSCYYPPNGLSIWNENEVGEVVARQGAHPIYLVFISWSDLNEVNNAIVRVDWKRITDVAILNEENRPDSDFKLPINGTVHHRPTEYGLKILLNSLIGEAFNKELEWCKMNDLDKQKDVEKCWDDFLLHVDKNPLPNVTTTNEASQSSKLLVD